MSPQALASVAATKRAVIYLRVSTRDQATRGGEAEGFSIPAQREACLRKAEAVGAEVVAEFVDAGESARSANRPDLKRMLAFVQSGAVDFVIVHKVDRLARNRIDDVEITVALTAAGSQLVSCTENIDETPSGMLLHGIMSSIAEFYSRNLATESRKGMRQKALGGGTPGKAPFGYINSRERTEEGREVRTVIVDSERAPWVQWMYERYASGEWTVGMMRDELKRQGVQSLPTPNKPRAPLSHSHINGILRNRYYVGYVSFEKVQYRGKHPALISEALFDVCQQIREGRIQSREKPRIHTHYLKGSIYCGQCGEPLSFEASRNRLGNVYEYFYCLGRQRLKNGCTFRATQVDLVEELVEDHWSTVTLLESQVREIRDIVWEHIEQVVPLRVRERQDAERRLISLRQESDKLLQAHLADAVPLDQLRREQARIATETAATERRFGEATLAGNLLNAKVERCCDLLSSAKTQYFKAADNQRRDLNQAVFAQIYIDDDAVVGSDLTPAFRHLLDRNLRHRLTEEVVAAKQLPASDLLPQADAAETTRRDIPGSWLQTALLRASNALSPLERPRGRLPWERKNPGPFQVRGSNVYFLVAGAGFEPATSGL